MKKFKHIPTNREFTVELIGCNAVECIAWGDWEIPMWILENGQDWEEVIEKINQPLFKAIDGVVILENQPYWGVHVKNFIIEENLEGSVKRDIPYYYEDKITDDFLTFSNKEDAERYIELNSPKYSIKDIVSVVNNWSMCGINENDILNFLAKK